MFKVNKNFQDLPTRFFSALLFGSVAVGSIMLGGLVCALFLSVCLSVLVWEVLYIVNCGRLTIINTRLFIPGLSFFVPLLQYYNFYPLVALLIIANMSVFFGEGRWLKFFCILYIGLSVVLCQELISEQNDIPSFYHLFLILAVVGASDIGGYFFGRIWGGAKIYRLISPNKTWAGSVGGLFLAIFVCIVINPIFEYTIVGMIFFALFLGIAAQAGDFFESFLKRRFEVKDSGFLLPGHGGLFDRLDGVLAAVPVYFGIMFFY
jgi:phosphatidate cytidylyltransferase